MLARLREEANPRGLPLPALARLLRENATDVEPVRLMAVVESLERDGLASVTPVSERSAGQPAGVVAEGRAPYVAGADREDSGKIRVSLT